MAEFIFIERSYEKDKPIIIKQIKELVDHPDPIWVSFNKKQRNLFSKVKFGCSLHFFQRVQDLRLKNMKPPKILQYQKDFLFTNIIYYLEQKGF